MRKEAFGGRGRGSAAQEGRAMLALTVGPRKPQSLMTGQGHHHKAACAAGFSTPV